jgi:hypothetical protein
VNRTRQGDTIEGERPLGMMRVSSNRSFVRLRDKPNEHVEIVSCPPVLYRFLAQQYALKLVNDGRIRVMPLSHYRDTADQVRGDGDEGEKRHEVPNGIADGGELGPALYVGGSVQSQDNTVTYSPPPSYCLCFSTVGSRELARRFAKENEPPLACVRISNPQNFLNEVDRIFRTEVRRNRAHVVRSFAGPVCYKKGLMTTWPKAQVPCDVRLIKDHARFAVEAEYRIIWSVEPPTDARTDQALKPVYLSLPECWHDLAIVEWAEMPDRATPHVSIID